MSASWHLPTPERTSFPKTQTSTLIPKELIWKAQNHYYSCKAQLGLDARIGHIGLHAR